MFIRYRIEPVGQKYGWRQGSSDCWYYASKSLLRFYGVANSKSDKEWAYLQHAKLIRMFINSMRKLHGKDLHHPMLTNVNMGQWINSEIEKIESTRRDILATAQKEMALCKSVEAILEDPSLWTPARVAEWCLLCRKLDPIVAETDLNSISAKRYTFLKIGQLILKYQKPEQIWTISEIFNSAFPPGLFEAVELTNRTAEELYKLLVKHGPLYTSGALHAGEKSTYSVVTSGKTPEEDVTDTRVLVESYITDSSHSVTVYGVSIDSGMVEYADPNDFTKPRRVAAAVFFGHLRAFEFNSKGTNFLKVNAANSDTVLQSKRIGAW